MRQHTSNNRLRMLHWLRECEDAGEPFPTDAMIIDRFCFTSREDARTLLADLADRGAISIAYNGSERTITLGKRQRTACASRARPLALIRKHDTEDKKVDETVEKIVGIVRRNRTPVPDPVPARITPVPAPAPAPVSPPPVLAHPKPKQINIKPSAEAQAELEAIAARSGIALSAAARIVLERTLVGGPTVPLARKPVVPREVLTAAVEARLDLHIFCSQLMSLGLEAWRKGEGPRT